MGESVTGLIQGDSESLSPMANLETPINLTCMSLDCERKLEYLEGPNACTGRTCKSHTADRFELGILVLTTVQLLKMHFFLWIS